MGSLSLHGATGVGIYWSERDKAISLLCGIVLLLLSLVGVSLGYPFQLEKALQER